MTAFLSGEMRDTVAINPAGAYGILSFSFQLCCFEFYMLVLERFFARNERARLFRSWAGSASMWIKVDDISFFLHMAGLYFFCQGGTAVWGNATWAPDDPKDNDHSYGQFVSFRSRDTPYDPAIGNLTIDEASNFILEHTPSSFQVCHTQVCFLSGLSYSEMIANDVFQLFLWHRAG